MNTYSILDFQYPLDSAFSLENSQILDFSENLLDESPFNDCYANNYDYNIKDDSVASQSTLSTDSIINFDVLNEDDINIDVLLNDDLDIDDINSEIVVDNISNDISFVQNLHVDKVCSKSKRKMKHSPILPCTIRDIKHNNGLISKANLNNEDISKGRAGDRLYLSNEEIQLLLRDGHNIPTHLPLTKHEERALKSVRRKIRNKISAKNSRAKKESYVGGLEQRIAQCSKENVMLKHKLTEVEHDKKSLFAQVLSLRKQLAKFLSDSPASGTSLMLLLLTFMIILCPILDPRQMMGINIGGDNQPDNIKQIFPGRTRMLLQEAVESVELGEPYMVTIRASPTWQVPPKTRAVPLTPMKRSTNTSAARVVRSVMVAENT